MTSLKIAFRDLKNSKGFTFLFIFNLFLGVCGFVVLQSFRDNVNDLLEQRAKQLLAADITVSGRRDVNETELKKLNSVLDGKVEEKAQALGVYSMAKGLKDGSRSRLAQLKAVESSYPFYGNIELEDTDNFLNEMQKLQSENLLWVDPALLKQMKIELGDKVKLGDEVFTAYKVIKGDTSSSWGGIGLAPKVYMSLENLKKTNLVSFGSVATRTRLFKIKEQWGTKEELKKLQVELQNEIPDPGIRVKAPDSASEQVGRVLNYLSDYLGLVGLVALFLSGIGAGYLFQNYLFEKLQDVAILKSVGMGLWSIFGIYMFQLLVLNIIAVSLANLFTWTTLPLASDLFYEWISFTGEFKMDSSVFVLSFLVSLGSSGLICFPVLYKMIGKRVKNLFEGGQFFKMDFKKRDIALYVPLLLFMWGLAILQSSSFNIGTLFTVALLLVTVFVGVLFPRFLSFIDERFLQKNNLTFPGSLTLGMATRYFTRDKLSSTLSITALTIGTMLMSVIGQLETSIRGELLQDPNGKPSLFLFDIQEEQKDEFLKLAQKNDIPISNVSPMVRSRILKINGEDFKRDTDDEGFQTREEETSRRFRNRGVNLSYYERHNDSETIVEGRPFSGVYDDSSDKPAELSLEVRYAQRLGLNIGDTVTFDILGIEVTGEVINLRKVRWTSFLPNFFIVFQKGAIDAAPKSFLAAMGEMDFDAMMDAQEIVVENFPNISIVNVSELIDKIVSIFEAMAIALSVMALLCLAVGFFVLFAIIQNQIKKKYFETAIQKVFGLQPSELLKALLKEYFIMAAISCTLGLGFSLILGQIVSTLFFDGVWRVDFVFMAQVVGGVFAMTALLGFLAGKTFYSLRVKTLLR